jgi:hypothetical protein
VQEAQEHRLQRKVVMEVLPYSQQSLLPEVVVAGHIEIPGQQK